jgi:hypothetical protein
MWIDEFYLRRGIASAITSAYDDAFFTGACRGFFLYLNGSHISAGSNLVHPEAHGSRSNESCKKPFSIPFI